MIAHLKYSGAMSFDNVYWLAAVDRPVPRPPMQMAYLQLGVVHNGAKTELTSWFTFTFCIAFDYNAITFYLDSASVFPCLLYPC